MANIISTIINNTTPGPKRTGPSQMLIVRLDGDPSATGCDCPVGTVGVYNDGTSTQIFKKDTASVMGWSVSGGASGIQRHQLSTTFAAENLADLLRNEDLFWHPLVDIVISKAWIVIGGTAITSDGGSGNGGYLGMLINGVSVT